LPADQNISSEALEQSEVTQIAAQLKQQLDQPDSKQQEGHVDLKAAPTGHEDTLHIGGSSN
jgi:hypothetical protein